MITVADTPTTEKPPEYDTVCSQIDPPCYDDAIKLSPANLLQTKYYQNIALPNYNDLDVNGSNNNSSSSSTHTNQPNSQTNVFTARNHANSQCDNIASRNNAFTTITIEQTASPSSNETSITQKLHDADNSVSTPSTS